MDDPKPRLVLLTEAELANDPCPDQIFRLEMDGWWQGSPESGYEAMNLSLRLDSADLTSLLAQGRSQQLALASRISRTGDDPQAFALERERATRALMANPGPPADTALLELVLVKLKQLA